MQHRRSEEIACKIRSKEAKEEACSWIREKVWNAFDKWPSLAKFLREVKRELFMYSSLLVCVSRTESFNLHDLDWLSYCFVPCFHFLGMNFWIKR